MHLFILSKNNSKDYFLGRESKQNSVANDFKPNSQIRILTTMLFNHYLFQLHQNNDTKVMFIDIQSTLAIAIQIIIITTIN